jgi:hypothetical protein
MVGEQRNDDLTNPVLRRSRAIAVLHRAGTARGRQNRRDALTIPPATRAPTARSARPPPARRREQDGARELQFWAERLARWGYPRTPAPGANFAASLQLAVPIALPAVSVI